MPFPVTFRLTANLDYSDHVIKELYESLGTENILVVNCPDVYAPKTGDRIIVNNPRAEADHQLVELYVRSVAWEIVCQKTGGSPTMMMVVALAPGKR